MHTEDSESNKSLTLCKTMCRRNLTALGLPDVQHLLQIIALRFKVAQALASTTHVRQSGRHFTVFVAKLPSTANGGLNLESALTSAMRRSLSLSCPLL
eukprot:2642771-Amphidinium_carterae.1